MLRWPWIFESSKHLTYEGDNNVLGQQASNWLLKQWNNEKIESPLGVVNFLYQREKILQNSFDQLMSENLSSFNFSLCCFEWLICHLLRNTCSVIERSKAKGANVFEARNDSQAYNARTLSYAFAEYFSMISFKKRLESKQTPDDLKTVLEQISSIYGLWNLDKHIAIFYIGGFAKGKEFAEFVRLNLIKACREIKNYSVSIADALSPPDFALKSVIGKSDGKVKNI
jgi:acyl-CoA oxidase